MSEVTKKVKKWQLLKPDAAPRGDSSYSSYEGSIDQCKMSDIEERIKSEFNCTVSFFMNPVAQKATEMFKELNFIKHNSLKCPRSCNKIVPTFGFPTSSNRNNSNEVRMYLNSDIKVPEDFVSYDLLRLNKRNWNIVRYLIY